MFSRADLGRCRRCTETVRWTTSEAGKAFAVNRAPDDGGNTAVIRDVHGALRSRRVSAERPLMPGERLMMPHAATCKPQPRAPKPPPQPASVGLYEVLGVPTTADTATIRSAYRKLARQLHPDINQAPDVADRFKQVTEAYDVLSDPTTRKVYDLTGRRPRARGGSA